MYNVLERAVVIVLGIFAYMMIEVTMMGGENSPIGIVGVWFLIVLILGPAIKLHRKN